jgi:aminoglycoside phosphotransferase (APT) family kinase protein
MKMPLQEGDALIRTILREQWRLEATGAHFIPVGDSAYSYRVEARPSSSYYLKVIDQRMAAGRRTAAHMVFSLPLQHLVANLHLADVSAPLPQPTITGALHATHGPFLFALYTFIHGETRADAYPMPASLVRRIGRALAALHTVQLLEALQRHSPLDSFTAPFDADLLTDVAALEAISAHDAPYLQRLREVTWPRRDHIRAFLASSQEYARKAQQVAVSAVVCHGDAWGGNMILAPSGQLTLLDWESAVMAPPERDAFLYLGDLGPEFTAFDAGYRMIRREPMQWYADWLAYYAYRRHLRNLAHWLHNLLHEPLDEAQRDNDVTMIEDHCLDRLEGVERTVTEVMARSADGYI